MYEALLVLLSVYLHPSFAATTTLGPQGSVSIWAAPAYSTIRPCAAGCLWYNGGLWTCGLNSGYYDLAQELQCSCSAKNLCYCGKDNAAPASSYISSCVSSKCSNFPSEVTGALALYDGYCATANVEVASAVATSKATTTGGASVVSVPTTSPDALPSTNNPPNTGSGGAVVQATPTSTPSPNSSPATTEEKKGLSQSDIIALAVGLGVGVPSLLLALATFLGMRKKKENRRVAAQEALFVPVGVRY
ncbi:hypothetical protein GLAREA_03414 [Glarea lozoyensis ATCC 20868]|uniref:CFEM domain-containing protein n=1 Tax=Glarea lozoyensis (strain ATCC 20868 / MF5171) TaxID=1116229 RepID=S3CVK7_GLAL2|nr:uncharacterized protein GLAREA_03414 [Glarea lozoyensis ATCC 20868]EPE30447.1 hypothetical protein GLAREA_03414 [Glarea lozoyensis ATCC 20868]